MVLTRKQSTAAAAETTAEERPIGDALPREMLVEASSWLAPVEMAMLSIASKQWVHIVMEAAQVWARRHGLNLPIVRNCCVNDNWCHEASEPFYPEDDQHYESFGARYKCPYVNEPRAFHARQPLCPPGGWCRKPWPSPDKPLLRSLQAAHLVLTDGCYLRVLGWDDDTTPPIYHKLFHLTPDTPFSQLMQAMVDYFRSLDIDEDETDNPDYDHKLPSLELGNDSEWVHSCCHEYKAYIKPNDTPRSLCFAGLAEDLVYGSFAHAYYDRCHEDKGWTCQGNGWRTAGVGYVQSFGPFVSTEGLEQALGAAEPNPKPDELIELMPRVIFKISGVSKTLSCRFKANSSQLLGGAMDAFCRHAQCKEQYETGRMNFYFKGEVVKRDDTPQSLGMMHGSIIRFLSMELRDAWVGDFTDDEGPRVI